MLRMSCHFGPGVKSSDTATRWLDRLSMAFSALMAVGWVSSSGANVMARRSRWSISALMKELLPPPPAPMNT